jgi:sugar lactone lactonase YvrE
MEMKDRKPETPVKLVADCHTKTGENPLWCSHSKSVYFTDIPGCVIYKYVPATNETVLVRKGRRTGGFTLESDGSLILFEENQIIHFSPDRGEKILATVTKGIGARFNDVIADPEGRIYAGTIASPTESGSLMRIDPNGTITVLLEDVGVGNGMGFSKDQKRFYFTDTRSLSIYVFDYDRKTGEIKNKKLFIETTGEESKPDGLTIDSEDYIWSARWGGAEIVRYNPKGEIERRIKVPARNVTSLIFGGVDYADIYITSATARDDKTPPSEYGGGLYHLNLGIQGKPEFCSKLS